MFLCPSYFSLSILAEIPSLHHHHCFLSAASAPEENDVSIESSLLPIRLAAPLDQIHPVSLGGNHASITPACPTLTPYSPSLVASSVFLSDAAHQPKTYPRLKF
ncbi:hypothetical protein H9Q69_003079 [Fusarium xylarioides]|uniref:Uncharacterized protein n=1 Tax=Fusarium xylarioides TaxID=221167 RepID=A0A9P7LBR5_9HYPO|nr:hypothetical protein H9Q70_002641 [Fusarium xylarioides]KAG5768366.1 hypothetical protein H9Q72_004059 [Fusarium xylarioides]KAG5783755.1 hypothetical protein H9Q73_002567 [Fusarium xylarioides]KAG5797851.1 hypothetical protein H9Q69_003079 [Fusarium xylarioides]KAG5807960.1 hypothetical protein H9Q71_007457 [Fusarium xylarioides]